MATKKTSKTPPGKKAPPKAKPAAPAKPAAVPAKKGAALPAKSTAAAAKTIPAAGKTIPAAGKTIPAPAKKVVRPKAKRAAGGRGVRPMMGGGDPKNRLGRKWNCFSCGAKFYDLNHPEPLCPKCGKDQRTRPKDSGPPPTPPPPRPREPRPLALLDDDDATREDEALGPEDLDLEFAGIGEEEDLGDAPDLGVGEEEEEAGEEE